MLFAKVHRGSKWLQGGICRFCASIDSVQCSGENLKAIAQLINENFDQCYIVVADSLQRHNLPSHLSEGQKKQLLQEAGDRWLLDNRPFFEACRLPVKVYRWNDWLLHPAFESHLYNLKQLYQSNPLFQAAVYQSVESYLSRKQPSGDLPQNAFSCGRNYILEELAFMSLAETEKPAVEIYPGSQIAARRFFRQQQMYKDFPALSAQPYIELRLLRSEAPQKTVKTIAGAQAA